MSTALKVIFSDRLTQILDRRPDVIRQGQGRVMDLAAKFDIQYTTAYRLIGGKALPNCALLCKLAEAFDTTESWLLGRGPADVDEMIASEGLRIEVFAPQSGAPKWYIGLHESILPAGLDTAKLMFCSVDSANGVYAIIRDCAFVTSQESIGCFFTNKCGCKSTAL